MNERVILHCDLNNFFASVECREHPELAAFPVAVCGSIEERHGIVLAKNEHAKKFGVRTGEATWEAKRKCPKLLIAAPHYDRYVYYSDKAREIYKTYTDQIEAFGIDECWLDVTGSIRLFGTGFEIAETIRSRIKKELGLTVSIGVSFNKIFAKLGSDLKKPDATTIITTDNFKEIVWTLPCEELLYVGRATKEKLHKLSIFTIGDIASAPLFIIENTLGKNGISLWRNANGLDSASIVNMSYIHTAKSIGKSVTAHRDLLNNEDVWRVFLQLADSVSKQLREANLSAGQIQIYIRTNTLESEEHQVTPDIPLRSGYELAKCGLALLKKHYNWEKPLRTVGIRAAKLTPDSEGLQCSLYTSIMAVEKREGTEESADILRKRFGKGTVKRARLLYNTLADEVHSNSCSFNFMGR